MARPSKAEILEKVHQEALAEFDLIAKAQHDIRMQSLEDRRFASIPGAQYEGPWLDAFANKPRPEVNKVAMGCLRIENEYRNNEISAEFIPRDGEDDELADLCAKLWRADTSDQVAKEARDNAFSEGMRGGMGAWRLRAAYEDEDDPDNSRQIVRQEPIFEADSCVYFDLNAQRQDKSDAKRCFVLTGMTRESYMLEWDDDPASWPKDVQQTYFDWVTTDLVYVCEYYRVEEEKTLTRVFKGLDGDTSEFPEEQFDDDPTLEETLRVTGFVEVDPKKGKRKRVHKYILSGGKVLKDCGRIAGTCIPIIPYFGQRYYIDGLERFHGHVRLAKDAQRLLNMVRAKLAEYSARSSIEKPIFTPAQMSDPRIAQLWNDDNVEDHPYLLAELAKDDQGNIVAPGPIGYTKAPNIPPALAALAQVIEVDLQEILGSQAGADKIESNISGRAVELVQQRLDMQSYIYMSNFAKAEKRAAEVWLSMQRDLRTGERERMKGLTRTGETEYLELSIPKVDDDGEEYLSNDLSKAYMEVMVNVGPTSLSRREAIVRNLMTMLAVTKDQQDATVLTSLILYNLEGEGMSEVRPFFRKKLVRMGVLEPTEEEAQEMADEEQNKQPDANQQFLLSEARKAQAQAGKAEADAQLAIAKTGETQANTAKILAEADGEQQRQTLEALQALQNVIQPEASLGSPGT